MRTNFPRSEKLNRLALRPNEKMYVGRSSPFEGLMRLLRRLTSLWFGRRPFRIN